MILSGRTNISTGRVPLGVNVMRWPSPPRYAAGPAAVRDELAAADQHWRGVLENLDRRDHAVIGKGDGRQAVPSGDGALAAIRQHVGAKNLAIRIRPCRNERPE